MPSVPTVSITPKNGRYYAIFYDKSRYPARKWIPLGTRDRRVAEARKVQWEYLMVIGEFDPWNDPPPQSGTLLGEAIELYLASKSDNQLKSLRSDRSVLELLKDGLRPGVRLDEIRPTDLRAFVRRKDLKDSSQNTYHTRLKTFFRWCVQRKLLKSDPFDAIKAPKVVKGKVPPFLTREQYRKLLDRIGQDAAEKPVAAGQVAWLADVVTVAVGTGMRLGELCHMRWTWVDLSNRMITVKSSADFRTKSHRERAIPVAGDALAVLQRLKDERPDLSNPFVFRSRRGRPGDRQRLNTEFVSRRFLHYARLAELPDGTHFHTLRHTYASWLVLDGIDLYRVKELLGHATIETTMIYAHLRPDALIGAVERVFGYGEVREVIERYAA